MNWGGRRKGALRTAKHEIYIGLKRAGINEVNG